MLEVWWGSSVGGIISNSYSTGSVTGTSTSGVWWGIQVLGQLSANPIITLIPPDVDDTGKGAPKTTEQMKVSATSRDGILARCGILWGQSILFLCISKK